MTNGKTEFPGVTIDAREPVRMDYAVPTEYTAALTFRGLSKEVMRLSKAGLWVDPDLTTDEAAKAVIESLDAHIKHVVAERDAVLRQALAVLENVAVWETEGDDEQPATDAAEAIRKVLT